LSGLWAIDGDVGIQNHDNASLATASNSSVAWQSCWSDST